MNMKKSLFTLAPAALAVVVSGCGGGGGGGGGGGAYGAAQPASKPVGAAITVKASKLGNLLVDAQGRTLYLFEADKTSASTCYSACASVWPPLTTSGGAPTAGAQVNGLQLSTTKRSDGKAEVTYNGHPLYYYAGDTAPGAVTGQGLNQFGGKWYVVAPSGSKIDNG
jgi:predicted lipoprotein with Yx(FWY)xxD motif